MDKTIFTLKHDTDFLFIQIYMDDIIFGYSSHTLMFRFQEIMKNEFQTYMMGELILFRHSSEANEGRHIHTLRQVHERFDEDVQHG
jgi:hypothetical protein